MEYMDPVCPSCMTKSGMTCNCGDHSETKDGPWLWGKHDRRVEQLCTTAECDGCGWAGVASFFKQRVKKQ